MWDPYAEFEHHTLSNGMQIHILHLPGREFEYCGIQIRAGSWFDPVGKEGVAHMLEHCVFNNVPGFNEFSEIREFFESDGSTGPDANTSQRRTLYKFKSRAEVRSFSERLDILKANGQSIFENASDELVFSGSIQSCQGDISALEAARFSDFLGMISYCTQERMLKVLMRP